MDNNNITFRTSMRGYNKEDVNTYISDENIRFNRIEANYKRTVSEQEKELEELRAKVDLLSELEAKNKELNSALSSLQSELDNNTVRLSEKDAIINKLMENLDHAKFQIVDLEKRITQYEEISLNDSANASCNVIKPEALTSGAEIDADIIEKAKKYDSICTQIDEILQYAKDEAARIINEAIEKSKLVNKTKTQTPDLIKKDIQSRSNSIIDDLKKTLRKQFKGLM